MKKVVYLFVFDSMADWEAGYAVAGINNPEFQTDPGRYVVKTVLFGIAWLMVPDLPQRVTVAARSTWTRVTGAPSR